MGFINTKLHLAAASVFQKQLANRDLFAIDSYPKLQQTLLEGSQIPFHLKNPKKKKILFKKHL